MTTKMMRIVGLSHSPKLVFVQFFKGYCWEQQKMDFEEFENMMKSLFPKPWEDYQNSEEKKHGQDAETFFYHYKETERMVITGEAYVFEGRC